ncbi:MAG: M23 family metallopeptidase [Bacteroidales bacterium]|nr:M23 family metallopeptidase [Bacteroidales bacterium]
MAKIKYRFDPHTLTYKKINRTSRKNMLQALVFFSISILMAVAFHLFFTSHLATPKEQRLQEKNESLQFKYKMLERKISHVNETLNKIEQRDDNLYRPIFELEQIPNQFREAGVGGVNRYDELKKYSQSENIISVAKKLDKVKKKLYVQSKSFDAIKKEARDKESMIAHIPAIQPIAIKDFRRISDYFGRRRDPFTGKIRMHRGMDFTGPVGTDIYATGDGVVVKADYSAYGYGKEVVIDHGYGYKTIYAHLHEITVEPGEQVSRGEVIGTLGNTGRSTGPHLHYEVRKGRRAVDPFNYYFNDITAEQYEKMIAESAKSRKPMD